MPIDVGKVVGARLPDLETSWDDTKVILYHLGVGAGDPPTSETELSYCYEPNLKVLPSFATIPPFEAMAHVPGLDGIDLNPMMLLHGEHEIDIHRPLPVTATVQTVSHITDVFDKGKAALIVVESVSSDQAGPLFTNRASIFARGEGGFDQTGTGRIRSRRRGKDNPPASSSLSTERRQESIACRSCLRSVGRLRSPNPAWALLVRDGVQGGRGPRPRRSGGFGRRVSSPICRGGVPG
jgi:hypothetical protein